MGGSRGADALRGWALQVSRHPVPREGGSTQKAALSPEVSRLQPMSPGFRWPDPGHAAAPGRPDCRPRWAPLPARAGVLLLVAPTPRQARGQGVSSGGQPDRGVCLAPQLFPCSRHWSLGLCWCCFSESGGCCVPVWRRDVTVPPSGRAGGVCCALGGDRAAPVAREPWAPGLWAAPPLRLQGRWGGGGSSCSQLYRRPYLGAPRTRGHRDAAREARVCHLPRARTAWGTLSSSWIRGLSPPGSRSDHEQRQGDGPRARSSRPPRGHGAGTRLPTGAPRALLLLRTPVFLAAERAPPPGALFPVRVGAGPLVPAGVTAGAAPCWAPQ